MQSFDWTENPLGNPQQWPQNLRTSVRIMLTSSDPMFVWWGEELKIAPIFVFLASDQAS
jgi:hypothetical protein